MNIKQAESLKPSEFVGHAISRWRRPPCVEYPMSKPLRAGIHEVITSFLQARIATGEHVDVAEMAQEIAQSLVDVIMEQEEDGQAALFAFALTSLGEEYLQRRGVFDTKPKGH